MFKTFNLRCDFYSWSKQSKFFAWPTPSYKDILAWPTSFLLFFLGGPPPNCTRPPSLANKR